MHLIKRYNTHQLFNPAQALKVSYWPMDVIRSWLTAKGYMEKLDPNDAGPSTSWYVKYTEDYGVEYLLIWDEIDPSPMVLREEDYLLWYENQQFFDRMTAEFFESIYFEQEKETE